LDGVGDLIKLPVIILWREKRQDPITKKELSMELKPLSAELEEVRKVIISSSLTTCYLIINAIVLSKDETCHYDKFRDDWINTYKDIYKHVSKMKTRKPSREKEK